MDKRSDFQYDSEYLEDEVEELEEEEMPKKRSYTKKSDPETVKLRLLKDIKVNAVGKVTGNYYSWAGGGAVVDVDILDKDELLKKGTNPQQTCCQDTVVQPYFEVVE
jgi:hypothetical protein